MEQVLLDTMYDLPSMRNVSKVVVDGSVISGENKPLLFYEGLEKHEASGDLDTKRRSASCRPPVARYAPPSVEPGVFRPDCLVTQGTRCRRLPSR